MSDHRNYRRDTGHPHVPKGAVPESEFADSVFKQCSSLMREGQYVQAESLALNTAKILGSEKRCAGFYSLAAHCARFDGRSEVALRHLEKALQRDGRNPHAHYEKIEALIALRMLNEAEAACDVAIKVASGHPKIQSALRDVESFLQKRDRLYLAQNIWERGDAEEPLPARKR